MVGPNTSDNTTTDNQNPGDADLQTLIPTFTTFDAAVLEFDFDCGQANVISFQYQFTSEEYNEFANTSFNDVFGFFLDGVTIALLPDNVTTVSINNVNGGNPFGTNASNPAFFVNNDPSDGGPFFDIEADGLTVLLGAQANISAGPHHLKLGIADAGDRVLDSWVFIEGGSFDCAPLPSDETIEKTFLEGPGQIGIYLPGPTQYVFQIDYTGPAALVVDTVPAEFECVGQPVASAGAATCSTNSNSSKSANRIKWDAPTGSNTLTVTIQTRVSPRKRNNKKVEPPVFKPTSCGPLPINDGATALEVDENGDLVLVPVLENGEPVLDKNGNPAFEPVVIVGPSNSLQVEAVEGAKTCDEG